MATCFFFPWLETHEPIEFGDIKLVPYLRGEQPAGAGTKEQDALDAVLSNYSDRSVLSRDGRPRPVQRATLINWMADSASTLLTDEQISDRAVIGQWVTFSALSQRRFASHGDYCNADDLQLVVQRFDETRPSAVALQTRRRDGVALNYISMSREASIFVRPHHAQAKRIDLDISLIQALIKAEDDDLRDRLVTSITIFNRANTDSDYVSQNIEMTLMRVAFETLLGCGFEAKGLQAAFDSHFVSELPKPPVWGRGKCSETLWLETYPKFTKRPLDAWVQDFCAVRNRGAHGKKKGGKEWPDPVWSVHNHLLFAAWLFPLMVKKVLSDAGLYTLSELDRDYRKGFEEFFAHDILSPIDGDEATLWWSKVEQKLHRAEMARALYRYMN